MRTKTLLLLVPFLMFVTQAMAQQSLLAGGGVMATDADTVIFAVGQSMPLIVDDPESVSSGTIQPYQILTLPTAVEDAVLAEISVQLFPNPTAGDLILRLQDERPGSFEYHLYDLAGKVLAKGRLRGTETLIPTATLHAGEYLLMVTQQKKKVKTFKIIKK